MTDEVRNSEDALYSELYAKTLRLLEEQGSVPSAWRRAVLADQFAKQVCEEVSSAAEAAKMWSEKVVGGGMPLGKVVGLTGQGFKWGEIVDCFPLTPLTEEDKVLMQEHSRANAASLHSLEELVHKLDMLRQPQVATTLEISLRSLEELVHKLDRLGRPQVATTSDIHTKTAAEIFGVPETEVTKGQRNDAKDLNFCSLHMNAPPSIGPTTEPTKDK